LDLLTCKNRLPYNLYCVGGDVKHCPIQSVLAYYVVRNTRRNNFLAIAQLQLKTSLAAAAAWQTSTSYAMCMELSDSVPTIDYLQTRTPIRRWITGNWLSESEKWTDVLALATGNKMQDAQQHSSAQFNLVIKCISVVVTMQPMAAMQLYAFVCIVPGAAAIRRRR